ncbi:DUF3613 domain-containing protein [Pseudomonas sp. Marseille-P9899]|uniref:DUF3613 domain-containing protein n=1 Tax=Pseudomonas sp. Marseille-P9899 TaxID=2730401 RepID=UPI001588DE3A|nr:DUF3613 domain-containing protein [Pseudomonas sp. Marseille-P9899]
MNVRIPLLIVLAGFSCAVAAAPEGPSSKAQETTETWLQLQPRGLHASSNPQATTPMEYDKSMERFKKVYDYKIPEVVKWEKATSSGSQ